MPNPSTRSKLVGFKVRHDYDEPGSTESSDERYERLRQEYKKKKKLFIDLDAIINDPCPLERLRRNLDDQDVEQIYKDEVIKIMTKNFKKHGIRMCG